MKWKIECCRCHKIISDDGDPVEISFMAWLGFKLGFIPTEWYCFDCHNERRKSDL